MEPRNRPSVIPSKTLFGMAAAITSVALFLLPACGGGGGGSGGPASALSLPDQITMTDVDNQGTGGSYWGGSGYGDPGTDYTQQEKQTWVHDTDALTIVNDILGAMHDTAYEHFLNKGPYKALVSPVGEKEQDQGGNTAGNTTVEKLQEMTVDVSRASNSAPMIIRIWMHMDMGGPSGPVPALIRGYFEVTQGVSAAYPLGAFRADFMATLLDENGEVVPGDPIMQTAMQIGAENGQVTVKFVEAGKQPEQGGNYAWDNRLHVLANEDLSSGKAYLYSSEKSPMDPEPNVTKYWFAYNEDYFKTKASGQSEAVMDKHAFSHRVFDYRLFHEEDGSKVSLNSGFPVKFKNGAYGYIGYYGVWAPDGTPLHDGDTVTRADDGKTFTLFYVRGKLTKHTRMQTTLGDLTGLEFFVWDSGQNLVITWDGTQFMQIGVINDEDGTIQYLENPVPYTFQYEWEGGWCDALQAWIPLGGLTPTNSDIVYYHMEETINPATAQDLTLYYWGFALDAPITQQVIDGADQAEQAYWSGPPTEKQYFFDALHMVLREQDAGGAQVILGKNLDLEGTKYMDGYYMSPLTTNGNYDENTCWQIWDEEVYYNWTTGPQTWNQFTTVEDAQGSLMDFDPPLKLSYTHTTQNDINGDATYDGKPFMLEYDGYHLQIPWEYDPASGNWIPSFNLKDGVVMAAADDPQDQYVVKGVEEELVMAPVTDPDILDQLETELPIDKSIPPPDIVFDPSKTALVGDEPAQAKLKVVKGELVDSE